MSKIKDSLMNGDSKLKKWNVLTDISQLEDVVEASGKQPQLIYKHSHRCGTCFISKRKIEGSFDEISSKAGMNFVNVIKARDVSNAIAEKLDVRHESPQVLIVKNGKCVGDESHFAIKADAILEALK